MISNIRNAVTIPTLSDGSTLYTIGIELDGVGYNFKFSYSTRENVWYLDILDDYNDPLLLGIKLVQGYYLCEYQKEFRRLFEGDLLVLTGTNTKNPPGLIGLGPGSDWKLIYIPRGEL